MFNRLAAILIYFFLIQTCYFYYVCFCAIFLAVASFILNESTFKESKLELKLTLFDFIKKIKIIFMLKKKHYLSYISKIKKSHFLSKKSSCVKLQYFNLNNLISFNNPNFCFKSSKYKTCFKDFMLSRHSTLKHLNNNKLAFFKKKMLNRAVFLHTKPFFFKLKIMISGRVFKWCLFRNKITFHFIHSNKKYFFLSKRSSTFVVKKGKTSFFINFHKPLNKTKLLSKLKLTKETNIFTKRGIVVRRSVFFKKKGKVSTYTV